MIRHIRTVGIALLTAVAFSVVAQAQPDALSPSTKLEIRTVELMLAEAEGISADDPTKYDELSKLMDTVYGRLFVLFTLDSIDNVDLWKLAGRYELARQRRETIYIRTSIPLFHIARLYPDYDKDAQTLSLMAKLNRYAKPVDKAQAAADFGILKAWIAADRSQPKVQFQLAECYRTGKGLMFPNEKEASLWYAKAADGGDLDAAARLGAMLLDNRSSGGAQNEERGIALLKQANDGGSGIGAYELGLAFAAGRGVPKDKVRALELYKVALDRGQEGSALFALMHGSDGAEAVHYAEIGIERGYLTAHFVLGGWYLNGEKIPPDVTKAIEHFENGAKSGNRACAEQLVAVFRVGYGIEKDAARASKWESTAMSLGSSAGTIKNAIGELENRKKFATALGKKTIDQATYRAEVQAALAKSLKDYHDATKK